MSRVPADWGSPPDFVFGNRESFKDYAASDLLPRWLRVTYAAYANVQRNGHANFPPGDLAALLADTVDGVKVPLPRQRVAEAIRGAKERGLLLNESKARCLVVPSNVVAYGKGGYAQCRLHKARKRNEESVSTGSEMTRSLQVVSDLDERRNRVVQSPRPSLLSAYAASSEAESSCIWRM